MSSHGDLHSAWSSLFARALVRAGVTDAVVSPGSRSTPLALAFAREEGLRVQVAVDERSAAFFALGQGRVTARPTVLLCTSGTAGAHYLPAIIEASESRVPLIAVTADRPWELQDARASQTIDQRDLFGRHVRRSIELGLPDPEALPAVGRFAALAVTSALHPRPGSVHVNAHFRKPLEPVASNGDEAWRPAFDEAMGAPGPRVSLPTPGTNEAGARLIADACARSRKGILAVGPTSNAAQNLPEAAMRLRRALARLAEAHDLAIFAESTSQARFGEEVEPFLVGGFDAILRSGAMGRSTGPDQLIEIFSPLTSQGYASLAASGTPRIIVTDDGIPDPHGNASDVVIGDVVSILERAAELSESHAATGWRRSLVELSKDIDRLTATLADETFSEAFVAREVLSKLPAGGLLAIGNSLPVRDLDTFAGSLRKPISVAHQRGAAGIDGLVAGATGARSSWPASSPVVLVLGDVSAQHDAGSFALLAGCTSPMVVIVVDNGGGRIFEELPIARDPSLRPALDRFFVTPRGEGAGALWPSLARGFGVQHAMCRDRASFTAALSAALEAPRATLIEAVVGDDDGGARRRAHRDAVARACETFFERRRA